MQLFGTHANYFVAANNNNQRYSHPKYLCTFVAGNKQVADTYWRSVTFHPLFRKSPINYTLRGLKLYIGQLLKRWIVEGLHFQHSTLCFHWKWSRRTRKPETLNSNENPVHFQISTFPNFQIVFHNFRPRKV